MPCGVPCPPFSSKGDARGFQDGRAQVLLHTTFALDVAFLLGANYVILECTPFAGDYYCMRFRIPLVISSPP